MHDDLAADEHIDVLVVGPGGEPLNPNAVSIQLKRRAARLGLPPIRFHDLRHAWTTMALEAGEHPKVVAEQLGHASVRVTLDTYSHVTPGVQRDAVPGWPAASSIRLLAGC